jgi:hypothetical protein
MARGLRLNVRGPLCQCLCGPRLGERHVRTATLHFSLKHLSPDQEFTVRVGSRAYTRVPHTRQTLGTCAAETRLTTVAKGHLRKQLFPSTRVYAVGANKEVGCLFRSIFEMGTDLSGFLGETSELTPETQYAGLKRVRQYLDQVGATYRDDAVSVPSRQLIQTCPLSTRNAHGCGDRASTRIFSGYCDLAYSTLASFRMGMLGSASFQRVRKSL